MSGPAFPTETEVGDLLARILGVHDRPAAELIRADMAEWDSLKHMEIVFALEDRYSVRFEESEFAVLTTPAAINAALRKHLAT